MRLQERIGNRRKVEGFQALGTVGRCQKFQVALTRETHVVSHQPIAYSTCW